MNSLRCTSFQKRTPLLIIRLQTNQPLKLGKKVLYTIRGRGGGEYTKSYFSWSAGEGESRPPSPPLKILHHLWPLLAISSLKWCPICPLRARCWSWHRKTLFFSKISVSNAGGDKWQNDSPWSTYLSGQQPWPSLPVDLIHRMGIWSNPLKNNLIQHTCKISFVFFILKNKK